MAFRVDNPIGFLPYAINPDGETVFLLWKADQSTADHSSVYWGDLQGIKTRYDSTMWDVCARTWVETTGALFHLSEELRIKREKREKKEKLAAQAEISKPTSSSSSRDSKKDKKDKKDKKSSSKPVQVSLPSLDQHVPQTHGKMTIYSELSKKVKHYNILMSTYNERLILSQCTKIVRKMLTSRHKSTVILTSGGLSRPRFVYCCKIEYIPIWQVNLHLSRFGSGQSQWVKGTDLLHIALEQQIAYIRREKKRLSDEAAGIISYHDDDNRLTLASSLNKPIVSSTSLATGVPSSIPSPSTTSDPLIVDVATMAQSLLSNDTLPSSAIHDDNTTHKPTIVIDHGNNTIHTINSDGTMTKSQPFIPADQQHSNTFIVPDTHPHIMTYTDEDMVSTDIMATYCQLYPSLDNNNNNNDDGDGDKVTDIKHTTTNKNDIPEDTDNTTTTANNKPEQSIKKKLIASIPYKSIPLNFTFLNVLTLDSILSLLRICAYTSEHYQLPVEIQEYITQRNNTTTSDNTTTTGHDQYTTTPLHNKGKKVVLSSLQQTEITINIQLSHTIYKCRQCRQLLFTNRDMETHKPFNFETYAQKAIDRHIQQQGSGDANEKELKKVMIDTKQKIKLIVRRVEKEIVKRKIRDEIAMFEGDYDFDDDDDDDDGYGDDDDDEDDYDNDDNIDDHHNDDDDDEDDYDGDNTNQNTDDTSRHSSSTSRPYNRVTASSYYLLSSYQGYYDEAIDEENWNDDEINYRLALRDLMDQLREIITDLEDEMNNNTDNNNNSISATTNTSTTANAQHNDVEVDDVLQGKGTGIYLRPVFAKSAQKSHIPTNTEASNLHIQTSCQSYFLDSTRFLPYLNNMLDNDGIIHCVRCGFRCGSYCWSGSQCSCGQWVVPGLQIPISKVDFVKKLPNQGMSQDVSDTSSSSDHSTTTTTSKTLDQLRSDSNIPQQPSASSTAQAPPATASGTIPLTRTVGVRRLNAARPPVKPPQRN